MIELSKKEKLFLKQAIEGKTYKEIAKLNFCNSRTIQYYFMRIFCKIGASCKNEAFYLIGKTGILD